MTLVHVCTLACIHLYRCLCLQVLGPPPRAFADWVMFASLSSCTKNGTRCSARIVQPYTGFRPSHVGPCAGSGRTRSLKDSQNPAELKAAWGLQWRDGKDERLATFLCLRDASGCGGLFSWQMEVAMGNAAVASTQASPTNGCPCSDSCCFDRSSPHRFSPRSILLACRDGPRSDVLHSCICQLCRGCSPRLLPFCPCEDEHGVECSRSVGVVLGGIVGCVSARVRRGGAWFAICARRRWRNASPSRAMVGGWHWLVAERLDSTGVISRGTRLQVFTKDKEPPAMQFEAFRHAFFGRCRQRSGVPPAASPRPLFCRWARRPPSWMVYEQSTDVSRPALAVCTSLRSSRRRRAPALRRCVGPFTSGGGSYVTFQSLSLMAVRCSSTSSFVSTRNLFLASVTTATSISCALKSSESTVWTAVMAILTHSS